MPLSSSYSPIPPVAITSLASDAPGYGGEDDVGPICWKCHGDSQSKGAACPVCQGRGRLAGRTVKVAVPGKITRGRVGRIGDTDECGPDPVGFQEVPFYGALVQRANRDRVDILFGDGPEEDEEIFRDSVVDREKRSVWVSIANESNPPSPIWLPMHPTEELCNLTGSWRILQRRGSHRWTTDDLVTAAVAAKALLKRSSEPSPIRYCDLGTGNGSVLHMVLWKCLSMGTTFAPSLGLEARQEAVQLARRSLAFNVGTAVPVSIIHTDFRIYCSEHANELAGQFDLVTGTPPYFRVDFDGRTTTIRQGGMPSAIQSAPARCEFRGGLEAYCAAAAILLRPETGVFCVCENYLNHDRALAAFVAHGLVLQKVYKVEGKVGRGTLFCVYVLTKQLVDAELQPAPKEASAIVVELAVRDGNGDWTEEYQNSILRYMSIPS
jgi:tRNA1Val (adenine37-N6)-methyltransferase